MFKYMFKHRYIALVKTITIRDEVYRKLASVKLKDESFSELFERLLSEAGSADVIAKLRGRVEFSDKPKMLSELKSFRAERRQEQQET
jgi:predicted CopG family antitoxin